MSLSISGKWTEKSPNQLTGDEFPSLPEVADQIKKEMIERTVGVLKAGVKYRLKLVLSAEKP